MNSDLLILSGSHMYGLDTPTSDKDIRGFCTPSAEYLLGRKKFDQLEDKKSDSVIWSINKFFHLLEIGSPNVLELLFAPAQNILSSTHKGQCLLDNKCLFICKRHINPILGFARSEYEKAFGGNKQRELGKQRKESVAKYGYSIKNAYHAIRLLNQGTQLLRDGSIIFPLDEKIRYKLHEIRHGLMSRIDAENLYHEELRLLEYWQDKSLLSKNVSIKVIDTLYYDLIKDDIVSFFIERDEKKRV
jgi:predicted nucleotidyltransferase